MTLDEAIRHAEETAEEYQRVVDTGIVFDDVTIDMMYCDDTEVIEEHLANYQKRAKEHRQIAEWLKDYKRLLEKESDWIPVSERLPEKNVEVLATTEWGAVTIAEMYSANDWFIHEGTTNAETDEIAAWMPLPEPYREVEE